MINDLNRKICEKKKCRHFYVQKQYDYKLIMYEFLLPK